jgi:hypothetical protein
VPDCVRAATETAERIVDELIGAPTDHEETVP